MEKEDIQFDDNIFLIFHALTILILANFIRKIPCAAPFLNSEETVSVLSTFSRFTTQPSTAPGHEFTRKFQVKEILYTSVRTSVEIEL